MGLQAWFLFLSQNIILHTRESKQTNKQTKTTQMYDVFPKSCWLRFVFCFLRVQKHNNCHCYVMLSRKIEKKWNMSNSPSQLKTRHVKKLCTMWKQRIFHAYLFQLFIYTPIRYHDNDDIHCFLRNDPVSVSCGRDGLYHRTYNTTDAIVIQIGKHTITWS